MFGDTTFQMAYYPFHKSNNQKAKQAIYVVRH